MAVPTKVVVKELKQDGYDPELFLNKHEYEKFLCSICLNVMNNPTDIGCNQGHNFCEMCINQLINHSYHHIKCPVCKQGNIKPILKKPNNFIKRLINDLIVKECEAKCGVKHIKLSDYIKHFQNECSLNYFKTKDLSPFITDNQSNIEIANNIKQCFEGIFGENTLVMVGDTNDDDNSKPQCYFRCLKPLVRKEIYKQHKIKI